MSPAQTPSRSCLLAALVLVAVSCSTSGNQRSAEPPATTAPTTTTTITTTTTTRPVTTTTSPVTTTTEAEVEPADDLLESFMTDCFAGSDEACDFLFLASDIDTIYEEAGSTCGERGDGSEFCTPGLDVMDGIADPATPAVRKLVTDCESGASMHACDLLFLTSEYDSEEEEIGRTCGGRVPEGTEPACHVELGATAEV